MHAHNERGPRGHSQDRASPSVALKRCPSMASRSRLCGFCLVRVQCTRSCRATAILLLLICGARYHGMERTTSVGPSTARASHQSSTYADQRSSAYGSRRWVPLPGNVETNWWRYCKVSKRGCNRRGTASLRIDILIGLYFSNPTLSRVDAFPLSSTKPDFTPIVGFTASRPAQSPGAGQGCLAIRPALDWV